jgi:RND superfamily putative drug exporter
MSILQLLAAWSGRHRWWAVAAWVGVLAGVTVAAQSAGTAYHNDFSLPGAQSQQALEALRAHSPVQAGDTIQIVVAADAGLRTPGTQQAVKTLISRVRTKPHVADVRSPYEEAGAISADGRVGYATVTLDGQAQDVPADAVREIIDTAQQSRSDALQVELGGDAVRGAQESEGGAAEGVGLLAALLVLVLLFGSLLAASLPIVIAVFAVATSMGVIGLASHLATVADFTPALMILVGLGVGIDYALLVFSRFRGELLRGADRPSAVATALDTAGRTVFFAACTVIIALLGLVVLGLGSLQGVAVAVAVTVLVTMLAVLTLLPALLAIMGGRIERGVLRRASRAKRPDGERWRRWTSFVQSRPWSAALLGTVLLLALAVPALGMRLGFADAGNDAPASTSRKAYDLLAKGFGAGFNGPLAVIVEGDAAAAAQVRQAVASALGVAAASPVIPAQDGHASIVLAFPAGKPQDRGTQDLVAELRADVLPPVAQATGATVLVGGSTAATVDFADAVADRLPLFVAVVVGLSALLLMLVFRSLLIPVKAAVLNLLGVGASLGAITLVFQHGLFGVPPGPIEAYVPVMIFAIAFGLSMDYEVFLLARMHEEWQAAGESDPRRAVREGLATTGRVVTAAAAIMVVVFGSFLLDPSRMLQQFGLGLAVAVLLDALVIRCLILPAAMRLFGARAWWLPAWLARLLPRVALEHAHPVPAEAQPSASPKPEVRA